MKMFGALSIFLLVVADVQARSMAGGPLGRAKPPGIIEISNYDRMKSMADKDSRTRLTFNSYYGNKTVDLYVTCEKQYIVLHFNTSSNFNGAIYTLDSGCLVEYENANTTFMYSIPLRSCNTKHENKATGLEYYNTVVIQTRRMLTGPGAQRISVRCQYPNLIQTLHTNFLTGINTSLEPDYSISGVSSIPRVFLEVYSGNLSSNAPVTEVYVGQMLTMVIGMESYHMYFMKVFNCNVSSGEGNTVQLYDSNGHPTDSEIMGPFTYSEDRNFAFVTFEAHKFPFTDDVVYTCDVRLCLHDSNNCGLSPPTSPGEKPTEYIISNEEFYNTFGVRNISESSFLDVLPESGSIYSIGFENLTGGPIEGGLTPEMIDELFYSEEENYTPIREAMRQMRSLPQLERDSIIYRMSANKTLHLELGIRVLDEDLFPNVRTASDGNPLNPMTVEGICWQEVKIPIILSSILAVPIFVGLIMICLRLPKLRNRNCMDDSTNRFNRHPATNEINMVPISAVMHRYPSLGDVSGLYHTHSISGQNVVVRPGNEEIYNF